MNPQVHVLTVSDLPFDRIMVPERAIDSYGVPMLESCQRFNIPLENLSPVNQKVIYEGTTLLALAASRTAEFPPDDIVLVTDCWDVFFCCGLDEIRDKFLRLSTPVVISAEANFFVVEDEGNVHGIYRHVYPKSPSRWRYANAGGVIGRAKDMLAMWKSPDFWIPGTKSSQGAYHHWFIKHGDTASLDTHCEIFLPLHHNWDKTANPELPPIMDVLEVCQTDSGLRVYNRELDTYPCSIHGNGGYLKQAAGLWQQMKGTK